MPQTNLIRPDRAFGGETIAYTRGQKDKLRDLIVTSKWEDANASEVCRLAREIAEFNEHNRTLQVLPGDVLTSFRFAGGYTVLHLAAQNLGHDAFQGKGQELTAFIPS